jgi:hypothetical protein
MYIRLHVKCRYTCQIVIKFEFSRQAFEKSSNIKFNENHPVGAELFQPFRRTNGRTDRTNLIVAFRNFVNAPKTEISLRFHNSLPNVGIFSQITPIHAIPTNY